PDLPKSSETYGYIHFCHSPTCLLLYTSELYNKRGHGGFRRCLFLQLVFSILSFFESTATAYTSKFSKCNCPKSRRFSHHKCRNYCE
ncbi:hypothetical protein ILUMI_17788, partial [Ignelater luminosus]